MRGLFHYQARKRLVMKISNEDAERLEKSGVHSQPSGKTLTLMVNGAILTSLNTRDAVAIDYLLFLDGVTKALLRDQDNLEKEANNCGRTISGHGLNCIGSVSIPKVTNK